MPRRGIGVMKSNFVGTDSDSPDEPSPVCPKPRRLGDGASLPEFLNPPKYSKHSQLDIQGRSEILDMIVGKSEELKDPVMCIGCSSPPSRSHNPLVHDVEFIHQMELLSISHRLGFTSASPL